MAPSDVQEQGKRKESRKADTWRRGGRDKGKPVTTSQIQAAEGLGLPCPPGALRKQGQKVAAPLSPPDSNRARTLWYRICASGPRPGTDGFVQTREHLLCWV